MSPTPPVLFFLSLITTLSPIQLLFMLLPWRQQLSALLMPGAPWIQGSQFVALYRHTASSSSVTSLLTVHFSSHQGGSFWLLFILSYTVEVAKLFFFTTLDSTSIFLFMIYSMFVESLVGDSEELCFFTFILVLRLYIAMEKSAIDRRTTCIMGTKSSWSHLAQESEI